jgi:hypothetical protein
MIDPHCARGTHLARGGAGQVRCVKKNQVSELRRRALHVNAKASASGRGQGDALPVFTDRAPHDETRRRGVGSFATRPNTSLSTSDREPRHESKLAEARSSMA